MTALGFPPMPWQQYVLDVALEVLEDGSWAYPTIIETVPRQAGKTAKSIAVHTHRGLVARDPRRGLAGTVRTWYTAQTRQHARDMWLDAAGILRRSPLGSRLEVRESNGSETVTFPSGATYRPFAPTEGALDSKANELVEVDECWYFDSAQGAALEASYVPTFTTTGGQTWLKSTAGTAASTWLLGYRDLGRAHVEAGHTGPVAYFEWSLPDEDVAAVEAGLELDADEDARRHALERILTAHPAHGYTLNLRALENALAVMTRDGKGPGDFLRAYGNRFSSVAERIIPATSWEAGRGLHPTPPAPGSVALAFAAGLGGSDGAILAAWRDTTDGPCRVDVIDARPGTSWMPTRILDLERRWRPLGIGYDNVGPSAAVADEARRAGVKTLQPTTTGDYTSACAQFLTELLDGRLLHPGATALDAAVEAAGKRPLGDRWAWGRQQSAGSIAALEAATVARWTFDHRPARRKPRARAA